MKGCAEPTGSVASAMLVAWSPNCIVGAGAQDSAKDAEEWGRQSAILPEQHTIDRYVAAS